MQDAKIKYTIRLNVPEKKNEIVYITTFIEDLEEEDLSSMLIDKGHLNSWSNNNEYTVVSRKIELLDSV